MLVDDPRPPAGHVRGADIGEALEALRRATEREHVPGSAHVDASRDRERNREVVDGGQMEDVGDVRGESPVGLVIEPQPRLGDVALDDLESILTVGGLARGVHHPRLDQCRDLEVCSILEQLRGQPLADEPWISGEQSERHQGTPAAYLTASGGVAASVRLVGRPRPRGARA